VTLPFGRATIPPMLSLRAILASPPDPEPIPSLEAWWRRHRTVARFASLPIDQAILGGYAADRIGYAFASGYQTALHALVSDLPPERFASFCVTERGGGHPRVIETRLTQEGAAAYRVTGKKRWAIHSPETSVLVVATSEGNDEHGRNRLRLVRIESTAPGVKLQPMAEPPFAPEISHDELDLAGVLVAPSAIYPGDGFSRYVRPFRTVEDLHVFAAILAYLLREIRLHGLPRQLAERLAGILAGFGALAAKDPSAPEIHVALAGLLELSRPLIAEIDRVWGKTESPAHARWERDRLMLTVTDSVREKRASRAWDRLETPDVVEDDTTGA
jgi:acyl-CoA dehydrogenase